MRGRFNRQSATLVACLAAVMATAHPTPAFQQAPTKAAAPAAADLDRLLAPIALYPDQLLAQMLLCAADPDKIAALEEWLASNTALKGTALQDAAAKAGFEPSFVALVLFPQVIGTMASQIDWTRQLGQAFAADRSAVFSAIQRLRRQAQQVGTLKDTAQQDVETRTIASGQQVIVIEPANPQIVYVPQYNPQVVYTQPPASTVVVQKEDSSGGEAAAAGIIGFAAGIAIGAAIDNDHYYGPYGWGRGVHMYDDAWDDWYDDREDAREDWMEHREDLAEDRGEVARERQDQRTERQQGAQQERTERQQTRTESRPEAQAQREQRRTEAQAASPEARSAAQARADSRGYSGERATGERSGTRSDAFSGYSSGRSERAASQRGEKSRSSSRSGCRRR